MSRLPWHLVVLLAIEGLLAACLAALFLDSETGRRRVMTPIGDFIREMDILDRMAGYQDWSLVWLIVFALAVGAVIFVLGKLPPA